MSKAKERRRYIRLDADDRLECSIVGTGVVHVVGLGSHGHGMRVITDKELPESEEFRLSVKLTEGAPLEANARVIWQESWDFGFCNRHVAGLELIDLPDSERQRLIALIPAEEDRQPVPDEQF